MLASASLEHKKVSHMINLTFVITCTKRFPELIDTNSEVAKANVSQTDRVNLEAIAFITCHLYKLSIQNTYNMHNMYYIQNNINMAPPPARSICTTVGPAGNMSST